MQGYEDGEGFSEIGELGVEFLSGTELELTWAVEDMALSQDSFKLGLAAGWCGPDSYYCDHFPDGWGYPYVSFTMEDWVEISW